MEHRCGQRVGVDLPVTITGNPFSVRAGRLTNLSTSGAYIQTDADLRLLSRVLVVIDPPSTARPHAPTVSAYVARKFRDGVGIAWCEFAPIEVTRILRTVISQRRDRSNEIEGSAGSASAERFTPPVRRYAAPGRLLFHCPLRSADAARSRANIAQWNSYLRSDCVRSMVRMGWDYTT